MSLIKWKRNDDAFPSTFSNFADELFNNDFFITPARGKVETKPSVNVKETDKSYELEVAAPSFSKDNFNIDVDGNILTISGEHETSKDEDTEGYTRREFNYASFNRSFTLPESVNVDDISGSYNDGVLNVTLPKRAEATTPKKTIKVS